MCPYYACMLTLGWQKNCRRKFSFSSHGKAIFYFRSAKIWAFCEATPNGEYKNANIHFSKIVHHLTWKMSQPGICKTFPSTPREKDNFPESAGNGSDMNCRYMIWCSWFFFKSFLGSQYDISSVIQCKFSEAQPRAKNLYARRSTKFDDSLKRA